MIVREGIILKSIDYKDYSKLIYIIDNDGIKTLLVKGAKKPNSKNFAYSQPLTKISYDIIETKTFDILTTGLIINNYSQIKEDFEKTKFAYKIIELVYQFTNHIDEKKLLYTFLDDILNRINESKYVHLYEVIFRLKLLYLLGIGPIFSKCINCSTTENLSGFVIESGGMKCNRCLELHDIIYDHKIIKIIKFLYLIKLNEVSDDILSNIPDVYERIDQFINYYYQYFLGYHSKVSKVFNKL